MNTTQSFPEQMPAAWMGYALPQNGKTTIRICAWCADKAAADALALSRGCAVTHTICTRCYQEKIEREVGQ
jgi:superfamily II helicase